MQSAATSEKPAGRARRLSWAGRATHHLLALHQSISVHLAPVAVDHDRQAAARLRLKPGVLRQAVAERTPDGRPFSRGRLQLFEQATINLMQTPGKARLQEGHLTGRPPGQPSDPSVRTGPTWVAAVPGAPPAGLPPTLRQLPLQPHWTAAPHPHRLCTPIGQLTLQANS